ncbi:MAG: WHG domain-containing protein [Rhizobiaceae bacterium]|nr:WHG domain-containing protein [Rhizobiaceae bacterium]
MAGRREMKREDLKARLIEAATRRIAENGLANLRARDVTQDAGCALGGLYTVFRDLDELVLHVNSATLGLLEADLVAALEGREEPAQQLRILAHGYLEFALANRNLWSALFDHRLPDTVEAPAWHLEKHMFLIQFIARPLATLNPQMSEEDLRIRALTLFAAVHGIISISLEARFVGIPAGRLESELDDFVGLLAAGAAAGRTEADDVQTP